MPPTTSITPVDAANISAGTSGSVALGKELNIATRAVAGGTLFITTVRGVADDDPVGVSTVFVPTTIGGLLPNVANTNNATVGAATLSAASLAGGQVTRSGSTAAYTDTTDTATAILAALPGFGVNSSMWVRIRNTVAFAETIAGGTGVTVSGETVVAPNSVGWFLLTCTATGTPAFTLVGYGNNQMAVPPLIVNTALNTVGAATITAGGIAGQMTSRGGAQVAAFTDTTDTATNIIAALPDAFVGQSFFYTYANNSNQVATIAGGTGVTVSGVTVVHPNQWVEYLVTYSAAGTVTMAAVAQGPNSSLQQSQFVSDTTGTTETIPAGDITGANFVCYKSSGGTAFTATTRTAAQLFADTPNAQVGMSWMLLVTNANSGTLTLAGGTGVTISGTATLATNTTRLFQCVFTSSSAVTMNSVGVGTFS